MANNPSKKQPCCITGKTIYLIIKANLFI